jgi:diaminopimelate decarboxylase
MDTDEALLCLRRLQRARLRCEVIHFHLRSNVPTAAVYGRAISEVARFCRAAGVMPRALDCGGGVPPAGTFSRAGQPFAGDFRIPELRDAFRTAARLLPGLEEIWLENGRHLSAGSGVLVVSVLDAKERRGLRHLICDGGRTLHALVSNWESHALLALPKRRGTERLTTVCGPTCMAFDQLARQSLPASLRPGDRLVWMDAGAYHLPWETRFSHGTAAVLWLETNRLLEVRRRESFEQWWNAQPMGRD